MRSKFKTPYKSKKSLVKKVAVIERTLRVRKPEVKNYHVLINQSITNVGTMYPMSAVAEGPTSAQRVGLDISATHLTVIGRVSAYSSVTAPQCMRVIAFIDRQQVEDTYPSIADVLRDVANSPISQYTEIHKGRFKILKDLTFYVDYYNLTKTFKMNIPLKGMKIHYNGSSASDYQKNCVWLMAISDFSTATPVLYATTKFDYIDC